MAATGFMMQAKLFTAEGYSGGPVTTTDGSLAGMVIGRTEDDALANIVVRPALSML